jgi:hypothetical protein
MFKKIEPTRRFEALEPPSKPPLLVRFTRRMCTGRYPVSGADITAAPGDIIDAVELEMAQILTGQATAETFAAMCLRTKRAELVHERDLERIQPKRPTRPTISAPAGDHISAVNRR